MPSSAEKLLEKARKSKGGWSSDELLSLYTGYGFTIRNGQGSHRIVTHSVYRELRAVVPHPGEIGKAYVSKAVKLIEASLRMQRRIDNE